MSLDLILDANGNIIKPGDSSFIGPVKGNTGDANSYWQKGYTGGYNNSTGTYTGNDANERAGFLAGQKSFVQQKGSGTGAKTDVKDKTNNVDNNLVPNAKSEYDRQKEAIMSRLQVMKDEAGRLRGQAKGQYDFSTGEIGKNYGKLKELSVQKLGQALEGLTQEDTAVQNTYGRVAGNSRRAMESAITRNRMLNRAMGSLGSSFYANSQNDTTNQGMNTVNDTMSEEAAKRTAIGTQRSATTTDFATNDVAITAEETALNNQALLDFNNSKADADNLEREYNIDSTDAIKAADNQLTSSLASIKDYIQTKSVNTTSSSLNQSNNGNGAGFVKSYDALAPINKTLQNNTNIDSANKFIADSSASPAGLGAGASDTGSQSYLTYLKNRTKKPKEDTSGYFQNA